ncbi:hypothetical protein ACQPYK_08630 [Streptosporangium sp. CA-135522]|uniref:hypothetical protein n=1 Tax=Streptosporangium sp. CA-135522 TaxID=3240072 RepID=UPI003D8F9BF6
MTERRVQGPQERAVRKDIRRLASLDGAESYAAMAIELAKTLDAGDLEAAERSRLTSELRKTMIELSRTAPKKPATDHLDELRQRREQTRATGT